MQKPNVKKQFNLTIFRFFIKSLFTVSIIIISLFASFYYETFYSEQKVFSSENKSQSTVIERIGEMISVPKERLKGEEKNRINILILGIGGKGHSGGDLTDTIMIFSIKPYTKEAAIISIPRDLYVQIPKINFGSKINAVKTIGNKKVNKKYGNNKYDSGIELLKKTIGKISGLDIHYYLQIDFDGFIKIVDEIGGIDIFLKNEINDPSYPDFARGYDPFYISKGWHHLDGRTALRVARSRHSKMGDFDRIKRQQDIVKAIKTKAFEKYSKFDIIAVKNMIFRLGDSLTTDIQVKEIPRFYKIIKNIENYNIVSETIDTKRYLKRIYVGKGYTLGAKSENYNKIKKMASEIFSEKSSIKATDAVKKENATIEINNGTGVLDFANKISREMEKIGLKITVSKNIKKPNFSGVKIYDRTNGSKPETLKFLMKKFDGFIIDDSTGYSKDNIFTTDFLIIFGEK